MIGIPINSNPSGLHAKYGDVAISIHIDLHLYACVCVSYDVIMITTDAGLWVHELRVILIHNTFQWNVVQ